MRCIFLFGRPAYLLPFMLGVAAWRLMRAPSAPGARLAPESRRARRRFPRAARRQLRAGRIALGSRRAAAGRRRRRRQRGGRRARSGTEIARRNAVAARRLAGRRRGRLRCLLVRGHGSHRRLDLGLGALGARARFLGARDERRPLGEARAQGGARVQSSARTVARIAPRIEAPAPAPRRASASSGSGRCRCSIRPQARELPPLDLLDDPGVLEPSYSAEALEAMSRLVELKLKDFGVDVDVVAVHPGPVVTRFEMRPAPGVKASQITALSKDLARSLDDQRARGRGHPRQIGHGSGDSEREARDRDARGDHPLQGLRGRGLAAGAGARQGHRRPAGGRRSGAHAASADRRHHRLGQVGGHQCDGAEPAVQIDGRACAADHDRPEDARALGLRRHPAPALAGRHRHEAGGQRICAGASRRWSGATSSCRRSACATSPATTGA
jgi:hypothetical protein